MWREDVGSRGREEWNLSETNESINSALSTAFYHNWTDMLINLCSVGIQSRRPGMGRISTVSLMLDIFGLVLMRWRLVDWSQVGFYTFVHSRYWVLFCGCVLSSGTSCLPYRSCRRLFHSPHSGRLLWTRWMFWLCPRSIFLWLLTCFWWGDVLVACGRSTQRNPLSMALGKFGAWIYKILLLGGRILWALVSVF